MPSTDQIKTLPLITEQGFYVLDSDRNPLAWFGSRLDAVSFCLSKSFLSTSKIILTDAATKPFGTFYCGERLSNSF